MFVMYAIVFGIPAAKKKEMGSTLGMTLLKALKTIYHYDQSPSTFCLTPFRGLIMSRKPEPGHILGRAAQT